MHDKQRFMLYQGCFLIISFTAFGLFPDWGGTGSGADSSLGQWIRKFLLRDNWYLAELNHRYVKNLIIAVYAGFF